MIVYVPTLMIRNCDNDDSTHRYKSATYNLKINSSLLVSSKPKPHVCFRYQLLYFVEVPTRKPLLIYFYLT